MDKSPLAMLWGDSLAAVNGEIRGQIPIAIANQSSPQSSYQTELDLGETTEQIGPRPPKGPSDAIACMVGGYIS
jgi:hypothetical protein